MLVIEAVEAEGETMTTVEVFQIEAVRSDGDTGIEPDLLIAIS